MTGSADAEDIYDQVLEIVEKMPVADQEAIDELVRTQAVDEGCSWNSVQGRSPEAVATVASWTHEELAEVHVVFAEKHARDSGRTTDLEAILALKAAAPTFR